MTEKTAAGLGARGKINLKNKEKEESGVISAEQIRGDFRTQKKYMNYYASRDRNIKAAQAHHEEMLKKYPWEIADSIDETIIYGGNGRVPERRESASRSHTAVFCDNDTVSALIDARYDNPGKKIVVLNFASYQNPGGKFLEGSSAQEESLCHASTLFECLSAQKDYYDYNKAHKNYALYTDRALYIPDVIFESKTGENIVSDVITCAAPNRRAYAKHFSTEFPDFDKRNMEAMVSRISFIRDIAEENHADVLILGAFGCGVFGQDQDEVAAIFQNAFAETSIPRLIYAVPSKFNEKNANAFKNICERAS